MVKRKVVLGFLGVLLGAQSGVAAGSPWYVGVKGIVVDGGAPDSALNAGFDLGYRNSRYLSTELEYTDTVVEGETAGRNDWGMSALSAFAALRTATPVKLKGKLGVTSVEDDNGLELSYGVGVGFRAGGGLMEIEYTEIGDALELLSLGVNFHF